MLHILKNLQLPKECLALLQQQDDLLLIEDAVALLLTAELNEASIIYALDADVKARGLGDKLPAKVKLIDYQGFVELTVEHQQIYQW